MHFDYFGDTKADLECILGQTIEFEDQIKEACKPHAIDEVAIHPITPGLSGAAVFLVRRSGGFTPWIVKACNDPVLIIQERDNYRDFVHGKLPSAPTLIPLGSTKLLLFAFGGHLSDSARTLRAGYALSAPAALATLMQRIVASLTNIDRVSEDVASCADRMPLAEQIAKKLEKPNFPLPDEMIGRLRDSWERALREKDRFPRIRSTAHGDLNSGNVLFEPGSAASDPVFIDFASMRRSKDNAAYPEPYHLPFWDFVKLERDIRTRLFLKEAIDSGVEQSTILSAIRAIDGAGPAQAGASIPVTKLLRTTSALRGAIQEKHTPADLKAYRIVLAYGMLSVLFREKPDTDVPKGLQYRVAAESGIALLAEPFSTLPVIEESDDSDNEGPREYHRPDPAYEPDPTPSSGIQALIRRMRLHRIIGWIVLLLSMGALSGMGWYLYLGQAGPTWKDVQAQIHKKYYSVLKLEKSGSLLCATASDLNIQIWDWQWKQQDSASGASEGSICRQDADVVEQGADGARNELQVAVLYRRNKRRWEFWKITSRQK